MSLSPPSPAVPPVSTKPARRSDGRFLVVWAILLGVLAAAWTASDYLSRGEWLALIVLLYFGPIKIAALIGLTSQERREWTFGRLIAYFLWPGAQPRAFLPSHAPPLTSPVP